jgi:radical SAM superfamily enzyme with C-terminal helix-hairpin-helix motif
VRFCAFELEIQRLDEIGSMPSKFVLSSNVPLHFSLLKMVAEKGNRLTTQILKTVYSIKMFRRVLAQYPLLSIIRRAVNLESETVESLFVTVIQKITFNRSCKHAMRHKNCYNFVGRTVLY